MKEPKGLKMKSVSITDFYPKEKINEATMVDLLGSIIGNMTRFIDSITLRKVVFEIANSNSFWGLIQKAEDGKIFMEVKE